MVKKKIRQRMTRIMCLIISLATVITFASVPASADSGSDVYYDDLVFDSSTYSGTYSEPIPISVSSATYSVYDYFYVIYRGSPWVIPVSPSGGSVDLVWQTNIGSGGDAVFCYRVAGDRDSFRQPWLFNMTCVQSGFYWFQIMRIFIPVPGLNVDIDTSSSSLYSGSLLDRTDNYPVHDSSGFAIGSTINLDPLGDGGPGFLEINIPADVLAGFDSVSFTAYCNSYSTDVDTFGSCLQSVSIFHDGSSIPFDVCLHETVDQEMSWSFIDVDTPGYSFEKAFWGYTSIRFTPPSSGIVTIRFTYMNEAEILGLTLLSLKGFYSTAVSEMDLIRSIKDDLSEILGLFEYLLLSLEVWFTDTFSWLSDIYDALVGKSSDTSAGDTLVNQGQQIQDFEQEHQAVINEGTQVMTDTLNISGFAPALLFVSSTLDGVFNILGPYQVVIIIPVVLGMILFICSKVPGNIRPGRSSPGTKRTERDIKEG